MRESEKLSESIKGSEWKKKLEIGDEWVTATEMENSGRQTEGEEEKEREASQHVSVFEKERDINMKRSNVVLWLVCIHSVGFSW